MPVKKSAPYYGQTLLNRFRIPSLNNYGGVKKRVRKTVQGINKNEAIKRKSSRKNVIGGPKFQSPVTKRKKSNEVPQKRKWDVQRLDGNFNELKWLDEEG